MARAMADHEQTAVAGDLTRRDFIARGSALAMGAAVGPALLGGGYAAAQDGQTVGVPPVGKPPPTVVRVRSEKILRTARIDQRVLRWMLDEGVAAATGASNAQEAWQRLLTANDVVGLKFNRSGAAQLGTTLPMAEVLIGSLIDAGFDPARLVPIEVPEVIYEETGTTRPDRRWDESETPFGSGRDHLAAVLNQVTAIVNVPFLKTHNIAGMTCCLKNLSHALVRHPARFHSNHCSPYVADIVALPQIRDKLRLHVVNALRVVVDGGPEARPGAVSPAGALYLGTDPVAADTVGLEALNEVRRGQRLEPLKAGGGLLGYLPRAAEHGLGCANIHDVEMVKLRV
jgi:hypothetical protein